MSIETEISRIQTATTGIKTAIAGKGVTVPAGSQIDDLPALITSIPIGGEGGGTIKKVVITTPAPTTSSNGTYEFKLYDYVNSNDNFLGFMGTFAYYRTSITTMVLNAMSTEYMPYIGHASSIQLPSTTYYDYYLINNTTTNIITIPKPEYFQTYPVRFYTNYNSNWRSLSLYNVSFYYLG